MPVRVDLDVPAISRVLHGLVAAGVGILGVFALVATVLHLEASLGWLFVILFGVLMLWFGLIEARLASARPHLDVETDRLVVNHPGLLKRPLIIERDSILAVLFDDPDERRSEAPDRPTGVRAVLRKRLPKLFPLSDDEEASLYPGGRRFMPMIGGRIQLPDVAILARTPIRIGSVRRIMAASINDNDALRETVTTWGVFIRTTGSDRLRSALSSWSVDRVPTVAEVESLEGLYERRQPVWRRRS